MTATCSFFFFLVQRCPPLVFSFSRLLLFYSLSLSLFHLPCPNVFSPSGPFYFSFSPLFLLCSLADGVFYCQQRSSFSAASSWRCWWQGMAGMVVGPFSSSSLCFSLQLCSPLFSFFFFCFSRCSSFSRWFSCFLAVLMVLVEVERTPDDSSCFLLLLPRAEALLLLLVSFVPSVNVVLPSLQQLHGGVGCREWLWWELVWCGRPFLLFFSAFFSSPVLLCLCFFLLLFAGLLLTEMAMAAGGGGGEVLCSWWCCCGWEEDGEPWLREPGDSSCSFLSAAAPSLPFFAFFPLSLVFPSVSGSGEVGR